ncbi:MAG: ABC transporter ATP-binding protein [Spirochaetes bacterium]|nr:MAG: ABC transporter ATP-binding protein [Spirochaetota bacterium]
MPDIIVQKLRKEYKDVVAVRDVNITFLSNTVTCILGPSGCGKTTFLRMIAGLEEPTRGEIYFDNKIVNQLETRERDLAMVFQYPVVYRGLNVYKNIELPLIRSGISINDRKKRIEEVLSLMDLENKWKSDVTQLDNSSRQKVAVARVLARRPSIMLFDEPLTNVDVETKEQIKKAIKDFSRISKQTIIYVTHDQTEAMTLADKIVLMKEGSIIQYDEPRKLYNFPNDLFGGWFLGNPGMNFIEVTNKNIGKMPNPLLSLLSSYLIDGNKIKLDKIIIGIRPEYVKVIENKTNYSIKCNVLHKVLTIGKQYLIYLKLNDIIFKAKVRNEIGKRLHSNAWIEFPKDKIMLFSGEGERINN